MPSEFGCRRFDQLFLTRGHGGQSLTLANRVREFRAGQRMQTRLIIKKFDLGGTARLGEENHTLCTRCKMGQIHESFLVTRLTAFDPSLQAPEGEGTHRKTASALEKEPPCETLMIIHGSWPHQD
jgi:hypothetical protein